MSKKLNLPKPSKTPPIAPDEKMGALHWSFIGFMLFLLVKVVLK